MKILSKEQVVQNIIKISRMGEAELQEHRTKISMSDIDSKSRHFIYKAIDAQSDTIASKNNAYVVKSDISDFDGGV